MQKGDLPMADRQGTHLSVTGTGKVQVAPDEAILHFQILTEGRSAADAVAKNAERTQAVIDAVSAQPNHGVTTSGLAVFPLIDQSPDASGGRIVGFRAMNGVEVTTKPDYVGRIYDAGVAAGANQSSGITFRVQNEAPFREEALRLAVEAAYQEARAVASAANVALGDAESIEVDPGDGIIFFRSEALDAKVATTPVIPERQTISARVMVQFRMRDLPDVRHGKSGNKGVPTRSRGSA
jgi:uncharacterized protein